ncbi:MAG TPA: hypothetical protein VIL46_01890, partial [Gemmataceae bacterium]
MELVLVAEVVWRDLRTGRVLSNRRPAAAPEFAPPFDPNVPVPPEAVERAVPVRVVGIGRGIPELGESSTTALQMAIDHLAVQVRQMMEKPW